MKLTNTKISNRKAGLTLLELTVVILVLLSLVSILFVGARAWKRGSDRAASIMNIRNVQQAVRSHQNMYGLNTGDDLPSGAPAVEQVGTDPEDPNYVEGVPAVDSPIFGEGRYLPRKPAHPVTGATYSFLDEVPVLGELYMETEEVPASAGTAEDFNPTEYNDW